MSVTSVKRSVCDQTLVMMNILRTKKRSCVTVAMWTPQMDDKNLHS